MIAHALGEKQTKAPDGRGGWAAAFREAGMAALRQRRLAHRGIGWCSRALLATPDAVFPPWKRPGRLLRMSPYSLNFPVALITLVTPWFLLSYHFRNFLANTRRYRAVLWYVYVL